jgi:heme exporter protein A
MESLLFEVNNLEKLFNRRKIFSGVNFSLHESQSLAIVGRNGSGKSTLLKILAGVLSATKGETSLKIHGDRIKPEDVFQYIGMVAPYLQMYDEFSAFENLQIVRNIRGLDVAPQRLTGLLERVNLAHRRHDIVRTFSSGMKQRLKFAFALLHQPPVLLLDEPSSNLDAEGIASVHGIVEEQKTKGIIIIATNDAEEMKLCDHHIDLNAQKTA